MMNLQLTISQRLLLALLVVAPLYSYAGETQQQALVAEARSRARAFAMDLQQTLKQSVQIGGLQAAISTCNIAAPTLATDHSKDNWQVGRTSLKVRNPDNRPDAWEKSVLEDFQRRLQQGEAITELEASKLSDGTFRYMKAIPTAAACTGCHGEHIAAPVLERIDALYPLDAARGFRVGDIRGAFSLSLELK